MSNLIQDAKDQVLQLTLNAMHAAEKKGILKADAAIKAGVEIPKDPANGDYTTTFALAAAKAMGMKPRDLAQALLEEMDLKDSYFETVEIAGPGFLNFRLSPAWYSEVLRTIREEGAAYGRSDFLQGKRYMVEFVSANPTGPMHMGNARGGVLGDTLAAVLEAAGARVWREFYVNDAGNQIEKFAASLEVRYLQILLGEDAVAFPEDGYHGDDIRELAQDFYEEYGASYQDTPTEERHRALAKFGLSRNIPKMQSDLKRYGITYDQWFFESSLHESGYVEQTVAKLSEGGWTYEKDGALWLRTSQILAENLRKAGKKQEDIDKLEAKDDVLRRANGFYTYFAADIAYHRNKLEERGFDKVVDVWGADHHGHVARIKGAMDALGLNGTERLDVVLMQLVRLMRDGEVVRMSKRTGKAISLRDLLDEIPVDAARYFFNSKPDSPMDFDLGLAVRQDSENPVYYVQYAHARICTLLANMRAEGVQLPEDAVDAALLQTEQEKELLRQLAALTEEIKGAAMAYDPSRINRYVMELAARFHRFYTACRIKGEESALAEARLQLADCTRQVIATCLRLVGCQAPERM